MRQPLRLTSMMLAPWVVLAAACVQRPPPIVSPPVLPPSQGAPVCTVENGVDPDGHPACSPGCQWDAEQKACAPSPPSS